MAAALLTYFILLISVFFLLAGMKRLSLGALVVAILVGLVQHRIEFLALPFVLMAGACLPLARWLPPLRFLFYLIFLVLAVLLSNHVIPGFDNLRVYDSVRFAADSLPFTMYLNFDKVLVGIFILMNLPSPKASAATALVTMRNLTFLILLLAILAPMTGYVRLNPKFPELTWLWALNNFFFVCLAEEALFRGFIQTQLLRWMKGGSAVLIAAALFGLAHYQGGWPYVALAFLAGLVYGQTYWRTGRLQTSMGVHFGLNLVHFLSFSYPALQT
jgi:membrane protease YdiL (CAAX protease family)